jgi:hypothetical protein
MVLAAPELVVTEPVEMLDEIEIAPELKKRVFADRMVRGEKRAELQTRHWEPSLRAGFSALIPIMPARSTAARRLLSAGKSERFGAATDQRRRFARVNRPRSR